MKKFFSIITNRWNDVCLREITVTIAAIFLFHVVVGQSPTVTINQDNSQSDPTSKSSIVFTVTFSAPVNGFTGLDISFAGSTASGPLVATVLGGTTVYDVTVTGMSSSGTVIVSIPAGAASAIVDGAPTLASTSTDNIVMYIKPSVECPGNLTVSTGNGICGAVVNNIDPAITPPGASVSFTIQALSGDQTGGGSASGRTFGVGLSTVRYTLTDYPGISCSFNVTVEDHEPPVISCLPPLMVSCLQDVPYTSLPEAKDACTSSPIVTFVGEVRTNEICLNKITLTRTFKATDAAGNTSTCSQVITVNDNEPPHFVQPPPISPLNVSCSKDVPIVLPESYTAIDNCTFPGEEDIIADFRQIKSDSTCPNKYTLTRTWTASDGCGNTAVYTQVIHVDDKTGPEFSGLDPSQLSVSCASEIPPVPSQSAVDNCTGMAAPVTFSEAKSEEKCSNKFKLTRIWKATDACGNTSSRTQVIIVDDRQAPVFDGTPPSTMTVACEKDIPAATRQTATDNCGTPTINYSEVKSNVQCANRFTLTRTWVASDACGNTASRTQMINVYDDTPPTIMGISADPYVLWPPNHKMRDVTINYTATDNCGVSASLSVSSSDPVSGGSDGDQSPDWEIIDAHHVRLRAEKANNGQSRVYAIKITITDGCNAARDTTVNVIVAHNITGPQTGNPYKIGSTVSMNGVFWDKPGNSHTAKWLLDGSIAANGSVVEPSANQNGKVSGSYKFNTAGVYKLQMNVTDQSGMSSYVNTNNDLDAIIVIYDPNGGNAYGGGWYESKAGYLSSDRTATGKARYGFAVNYANASKPKGETQFEFKVGSFEFNALNFDYLSINSGKAQFKGTGKIIGGQSGIGFIMTVVDGAIDGNDIDKIRMKIYNRNTGYIYYDNQPGASEADDPTTVVGTNSSIVIQGPQLSNTSTVTNREESIKEVALDKLQLIAFPNPSNRNFSLQVRTNDDKTKLQVQVFNGEGKLMERRDNIPAGALIDLGAAYRPGIYFVRIVQGNQHAETRLLKLAK